MQNDNAKWKDSAHATYKMRNNNCKMSMLINYCLKTHDRYEMLTAKHEMPMPK